MQIASYLVIPVEGKKEELIQVLRTLTVCEVIPSENADVFILVTETKNKREERKLFEQINNISELQCLMLTYGHFGEEAHGVDIDA